MNLSFFEFSRKTSLKEKRFRALRIILYVIIFFLILTNLSYGMMFRSQIDSTTQASNSDLSKIYTTHSGKENLTNQYPIDVKSKEIRFTRDLARHYDFKLNYSVNDFYKMKLNKPNIIGLGRNSTEFDDLKIKRGRFFQANNELVLSESLIEGVTKVRDITIGDEIEINCKIHNTTFSKEYELVGIIEDRWISMERGYRGLEIIVPTSFFEKVPRTLTLDHPFENGTYNATVYEEVNTISLPEKYLDLAILELKGIRTSYKSSYEEKSESMDEYRSYQFVSTTFLSILVMMVIGLSFLSSHMYLEKFSQEIGVLRTMGTSTFRAALFVLKENIFVVIISIIIGLVISSISPAAMLTVFTDKALSEIILLNYGLPVAILLGASFTPFPYIYHKIQREEVIQNLRNE